MFTQSDEQQLAQHGIALATAEKQMQSFQTGFPSLDIVSAANLSKGILHPSQEKSAYYMQCWETYLKENHTVLKFVPASGAASRMFKDLFAYLESGEQTPFVTHFLSHLSQFAFYAPLKQLMEQKGVSQGQDIVRLLLEDMQYGLLPKGLLLFHAYPEGNRTPALEHLVEGAMYANASGHVYLHFTVSAEHKALFEQHVRENLPAYQEKYNVQYHISFSEQKPSTDTLAADKEGQPFRDKQGKLVFRPAGHGALLENLHEQAADVVFIKNIDNVVPDALKASTVYYKRLLAGVLVEKQAQCFALLRNAESATCEALCTFLEEELSCFIPDEKKQDKAFLLSKLNRPMRVCGMVRNEGEPGGGPFLVRGADGTIQLQILESSQIADPSLMKAAAYFNPVDLVCALRDYQGNAFDLSRYVDPLTGFISQKSKDGKELQALELPGLWNGSMADWNTIFVEVPVDTFNPVKTVNDLLRVQHQPVSQA